MSATTEKPWKPSHGTKARFDANAPYAESGRLAALAIKAAEHHRSGGYDERWYRQRIDGIEREAAEKGIEKEYREALRIQLEQLAAGPEQPEPPPAAATPAVVEETEYERLERFYREAAEALLSAIRAKDPLAIAAAELALHNAAFHLTCERLGWVSR